jgi:hypothetical protein
MLSPAEVEDSLATVSDAMRRRPAKFATWSTWWAAIRHG